MVGALPVGDDEEEVRAAAVGAGLVDDRVPRARELQLVEDADLQGLP